MAFWASGLDAFFQDFQEAVNGADRVQMLVASIRVAQLSSACAQFFAAGAEELCTDDTDRRIAAQACETVVKMAERHIDQLYDKHVESCANEADIEECPPTQPGPNRCLN